MSAIGLRVGPFEIVDEIRLPADGNWYQATRAGMKRRQPSQVLVRLLGPSPSSDEFKTLQQQYHRLKALDDPRIPSALGFYEGSGALAVVAEPGIPLSDAIHARARGQLEVNASTVLDLAIDIIEALIHAHGKGYVHGHLAPDHIHLTQEGRLWIWGFGLPKSSQTNAAFLSPERAQSFAPSVATDQWALGAMIGALLTGNAPWGSDADANKAKMGDTNDFVEPVETQWATLGQMLRRMLAAEPTNRFPSLHPVRQELLALSRKAPGVSDRRKLAEALYTASNEPTPQAGPFSNDDFVAASQEPAAPSIETAEIRASSDRPAAQPAASEPLPDEDLLVVQPEIDGDVPVAFSSPQRTTIESPPPVEGDDTSTSNTPDESKNDATPVSIEVEWTNEVVVDSPQEEEAPMSTSRDDDLPEKAPDAPGPPDASSVFSEDRSPAPTPLDAPPAPEARAVPEPMRMDFEPGLSLKGGARTVVPHSDPGSDADEEDEDEDVPTVLYTKEMTQQMLGDLSPQSVPVIKPASAPPETKSEFPILAVAPWLAIAAGILMVLYTLYHFM